MTSTAEPHRCRILIHCAAFGGQSEDVEAEVGTDFRILDNHGRPRLYLRATSNASDASDPEHVCGLRFEVYVTRDTTQPREVLDWICVPGQSGPAVLYGRREDGSRKLLLEIVGEALVAPELRQQSGTV